MKMNEIRKLKCSEFDSAIEFANIQFNCDFAQSQSKLYCHYAYGEHCACFSDGQIVGLLSAYPITVGGLKVLSVGTVCVEKGFRGHGIMGELFDFASHELFHGYELITLLGARERYEHFGFYKTGKKIIFTIKQQSKPALPFEIKEIKDGAETRLIYPLYNGDIQREESRFFNILRTQCSKVYLISLDGKRSYIVYNEKKNAIFELYGEVDAGAVLQCFVQYKNLPSVELYSSIDCDKGLFFLSDRYALSTLCNLKIINYERVITSLLRKVKNKHEGRLKLAVDDKFLADILVLGGDVDVKISEVTDEADILLSEKEFYLLLFDDYFLVYEDLNSPKVQLIRSWFPLPLWNTLTTLDGI